GGQGGYARDADVRSRTGRGIRRSQDDHGQADVPEHEADRPARDRDEETPDGDQGELHRATLTDAAFRVHQRGYAEGVRGRPRRAISVLFGVALVALLTLVRLPQTQRPFAR